MAAHKLTAPGGTRVEVQSAERRDALLARGYTEGHGGTPDAQNERTVETKAGSNDKVAVNSETGKPGRK